MHDYVVVYVDAREVLHLRPGLLYAAVGVGGIDAVFFSGLHVYYRSRRMESDFTSPVAGITRTSIMVSERVDSPSADLGLRSTPRTSTSSGSPEACSASLDAASLAASSLAASLSGLSSRLNGLLAGGLVPALGGRLSVAGRC